MLRHCSTSPARMPLAQNDQVVKENKVFWFTRDQLDDKACKAFRGALCPSCGHIRKRVRQKPNWALEISKEAAAVLHAHMPCSNCKHLMRKSEYVQPQQLVIAPTT